MPNGLPGLCDILPPMKVYLINTPLTHVERANLFFCLCPDCQGEINWRHYDASHAMHAVFCVSSFVAYPTRPDLEVYAVEARGFKAGPHDAMVIQFPKRQAGTVKHPA